MDFKRHIAARLRAGELTQEEIYSAIALPPNTEMGDYAFPCFRLAKALRKAPALIAQEIAAFVPEQLPAEELPITEELCEEAFRAGIAAKDFSVVFLQKQFRLKYIDACNLQDALRQSGKIKRAFLVGDAVCKG